MDALMTVLAVFCGIAIIGMFIGWWRSERRSSLAENAANRAERRAERYQDEARRARADTAVAYRRLVQYMPASDISEAAWFASVPRDADTIALPSADFDAKFDQFIHDLLGGN